MIECNFSDIEDQNEQKEVIKLCNNINFYGNKLDKKEDQVVWVVITLPVCLGVVSDFLIGNGFLSEIKDFAGGIGLIFAILICPIWSLYYFFSKRFISNKYFSSITKLDNIGYRYNKNYNYKQGYNYDKNYYNKYILTKHKK